MELSRKDKASEFLGIDRQRLENIEKTYMFEKQMPNGSWDLKQGEIGISKLLNAELLKSIIKYLQIGLIVLDKEGYIVDHNVNAEKILGWTNSHWVGKHFSMLDENAWQAHQKALSSGGAEAVMEFTINGVPGKGHVIPLNGNKSVSGSMLFFTSVPDFQKNSLELDEYRKTANELNAVLESMYDGLLITDGEGKILRVNSSWEKITGLFKKDVLGKTVAWLHNEGYCSKSATLMAIEKKENVNIQYRIYTGKEILASATPVFSEDGNVIMVVNIMRDLTDVRRLSQQLEQSQKMTEQYHHKLEKLGAQILEQQDIVAKSKPMREVLELAMRVANVDAPVLITGETGVGKEVVAKFIHNHSKKRSKELLLKINCAAIPENLLETELFGYDQGAFTGARSGGKPGLFEAAEGGTMVLDEIGELPLNLQVKLLKAIQDLEITRVGALRAKKVDVRIIAITNQNLQKMVERGSFREDLFFRFNVIPIYVSPLRERQDDLLHLIRFFLQKFNTSYERNVYLTRPVVDHLLNYNWPGNVRELSHVIERLVIISDHEEIIVEDLPANLRQDFPFFNLGHFGSFKEAVKNFEINFIKEAIKTYGSVEEASRKLRIDISTTYRKLRSYKCQND